jgi:hypothetical protein
VAALDESEVRPGLAAHLDTGVLRHLGGAETNAQRTATEDRAVTGPHYFLVLEVDTAAGRCTAVPLFSEPTRGSDPLDDALKGGRAQKWIGKPSYFSRWQHWRIPLAHFKAVSAREESSPADRRTYAVNDPNTLQAIVKWQTQNWNGYRAA